MTCLRLLLAAAVVATVAAPSVHAADPVRIGITTVLSGPAYDRGQSEQYGAQLALNEINEAGGVLGRLIEAYYVDNACKPPVGIAGTRKMIEEYHVPVVIGALCTPVTHAIEPLIKDEKVPLVIATSAGQDFVDASGIGGNDYLFKTIPSEVDIARGLFRYLASQNVKSVAILTDPGGFFEANGAAWIRGAPAAGMTVTDHETLAKNTDFPALLTKLQASNPDALIVMVGPSTKPFFAAYEASGWKVPVTGRFDLGAASAAVSQSFRDAGGLAGLSSIGVFSPIVNTPGVKDFVASYEAHYGLVPTQRSFFVYEAVYLVIDAIRRAGSDAPAAIEAALKTTTMLSRLGGTYTPDDHNHAHTPLFISALRTGKPAIIATE
jgi:branched-chain amino acid transport system substrate-binding protein